MWHNFEIFAIISLVAWILAIGTSLSDKMGKIANLTAILGTLSLAVFIVLLWTNLQRPPLRTLGETRLWYSFFLAISGYVIFKRWKIKLNAYVFTWYGYSISIIELPKSRYSQ